MNIAGIIALKGLGIAPATPSFAFGSFSVKPGAGGSTSGSTGGLSTNGPALSSQYTGGSNAGGQGNGTGNTLSNADLWGMYWSGAGAGSSSGSDNGCLADDATISAQYTGGSGIGRITPLVYNPESDGPPVFHSGVFTGDHGSVQFVQTADIGNQGTGEGDTSESDDKSRARSWWGICGWFLGDDPADVRREETVCVDLVGIHTEITLPVRDDQGKIVGYYTYSYGPDANVFGGPGKMVRTPHPADWRPPADMEYAISVTSEEERAMRAAAEALNDSPPNYNVLSGSTCVGVTTRILRSGGLVHWDTPNTATDLMLYLAHFKNRVRVILDCE